MSRKEYRTSFPPPRGYECHEEGNIGSRDYNRSLTPAELDLVTRDQLAVADEQRAAQERERDAISRCSAKVSGPRISRRWRARVAT